jgi:hypothetical protein
LELRSFGSNLDDSSESLSLLRGQAATEGALLMNFSWEGGKRRQKFRVVEGMNRPVILGCDFLRASKINLHIHAGGYTVGEGVQKVVPFAKPVAPHECNQIQLVDEWLLGKCASIEGTDADRHCVENMLRHYASSGLFSKKKQVLYRVCHMQ